MKTSKIHVLGGGAVGGPLAVFLKNAGQEVCLLRSTHYEPNSQQSSHRETHLWKIEVAGEPIQADLEEKAFSSCDLRDGWLLIATKTFTNASIAQQLQQWNFQGKIILLQNGIGVEDAYLDAGFQNIVRGVLYLTSQRERDREFSLRIPRPSLLGKVNGSDQLLQESVDLLSVPAWKFSAHPRIQEAVWKKTVINAVFNSICTLAERRNDLFAVSDVARDMASLVVKECLALADRCQFTLDHDEVMQEIMNISQHSTQRISTLQDVEAGRPTEMDSLNLELARIAANLCPPQDLTLTKILGQLVKLKIFGFKVSGRHGKSKMW